MYVIVAGGGKIGANVMRSLLRLGHEVTLIEQRRDRFEVLEDEFEHQVQRGDATEIYVLERAGIARPPDIVLALTGDDEDNMIVGQIAREKYGVPKVIARVNDPRNQPHFDLLGISPTICATSGLLALVEHEVPRHDLVHLLELRKAGIEEADAVVVATDGDNTNIIIGQVAQKRFDVRCVVVRVLDPARAKFYKERGLDTVCPTSVAIDALMDSARTCAIPVPQTEAEEVAG